MKDKIKKILSVIIVVCLCGGGLYCASNVVEKKDSVVKYTSFLKESQDYEVLFLGTSHVINGIQPMELWKDYGITSYNMGGHASTIATSYWTMMNVLDYTTPRLIVLDCSMISEKEKVDERLRLAHPQMDAFPLTRTKYEAVKDLFDEGEQLEFLWPFSTYHNRWNDLEQNDFDVTYSLEKGAESQIGVITPKMRKTISKEEQYAGDSVSIQYFRKIMEECEERDIEVLLTYLPWQAMVYKQKEANRVYDLAEEYGVNYINFLNTEIVNYKTDYYDQTHLNPSGARKVTDYIGQYIMEHYEIEDLRTDKAYSEWNNDYEEYKTYKESNLKEQKTLDTYLMLLADKNYNNVVTINGTEIWNVPKYKNLLENLGYLPESVGTEELDGDMHIFVTDKEDGTIVDNVLINYRVSDGELSDIKIMRPWG